MQNNMEHEAYLGHLIASIANGDGKAFRLLHRETASKLSRIAIKIVRRADLTADVMQESYIRIWSHSKQFDPARRTASAWMTAIVRNCARDVFRRKLETLTGDADEPPETSLITADTDALIQQRNEIQILLRYLDNIETSHREIIILSLIGWSREHLAEKFDRPVSTIKTIIRRGLLKARHEIRP